MKAFFVAVSVALILCGCASNSPPQIQGSVALAAPEEPLVAKTVRDGPSDWRIVTQKDELTNKAIIRATSPAKQSFLQHGSRVSAALILSCNNLYQDKAEYIENDYIQQYIKFTDRIGISSVYARWTVDDGPPQNGDLEVSGGGAVVFLHREMNSQDHLEGSGAKVRLQMALPFAGPTILEFATRGTDQAIQKIPCGSSRRTPTSQPGERQR